MNTKTDHEIEMDLNDHSLAHSESFGDLREILEYLLRKDFISPEDAEEAAAKFKTTYLTLERKDRFLPFLEQFVAEVESSDEYPSERVESLRDELEAFYDRMVSNFSIHRVAGYEDPDQANKDKLSDDIDESFDFASTHKLNQNLFGPEIPEKLKPVITKVLEQISTFHDQKHANRIQLISKWRYLRLAHQVEKLKRQAPALNTLQKYLLRKYGIFYKLRSFAQFQSTYSAYTSNEVIQKYKDEITTLKQQLSLNTSSFSKQENGKKNHIDVEKELQNKDARISQLEKELKTSLSTQMSKNGTGSSDEVSRLKEALRDMEAKMETLRNEVVDKDKLLSVHNSAFKSPIRRRVRVAEETPEPRPFSIGDLTKNLIGDLTKNGKLRYFVKILQRLQFKLKASGYTSMIKQYTAHKRALMNVTDRIKGRLLIQTRLLNCGQDIRRSFLKWLIKANPDFLRECFTKIGVTAKISHQIAIWRMKRLVFKPLHNKLPQAVKNIRTLKGFFILQNFFDFKNLINRKNAIYALNPNYKNKKILKVEAFVNRLCANGPNGKLKAALCILRHNRKVQFNSISRIFNNFTRNQEIAFMCMKLKGRHYNDVNYVRSVYSLYDRLSSNYVSNLHKVLSKLRIDKIQMARVALSRILENHRSKLITSIKLLRGHKDLVNVDLKLKEANKTAESVKVANILHNMNMKSAVKVQSAIHTLQAHQLDRRHKETSRNDKLKKMLFTVIKNQSVKELMALNILKLSCLSNKTKWKYLSKAFTHFFIKSKVAKKDILTQLKHHRIASNNKQAIDNKRTTQLVQKLVHVTKNKCHTVLSHMCEFKQKKAFDDVRVKDQLNYRLQHSANTTLRQTLKTLIKNKEAFVQQVELKKKHQAVLALMCQGLRRKMATCLFHLVYLNKESKVEKGKLDLVKTNLFNTLSKRTGIKANSALIDLMTNKEAAVRLKAEKDHKISRIRTLLHNAINNKAKKALLSLRDNANMINHKLSQQEAMRRSAINSLISGINSKELRVMSDLIKNRKDVKDSEDSRKAKQAALIRMLKRNVDDLKGNALLKLRQHNKNKALSDAKRSSLVKNAIYKLADNYTQKRIKGLTALKKNLVSRDIIDKLKLRLINSLKPVNEKPRLCLFRLRLQARSASMNALLNNQRARHVTNQLLQSNKGKLSGVLSALILNSIILSDREQLTEVENTYKNRLERRKRNGLLHLLVASLTGKRAKCLYSLVKCNETAKIKERELMDHMRARVEQLVASKQQRARQAFNALRKHRAETEQAEKALFEEKERVKNMLGKSSDPYETSKFNNFMRYIKTKVSTSYSNPRFLKLYEYMRENNSTGTYKDVLHLVDSGKITNLEEFYEYITVNNKQGQFKGVMDLYNARDLELNTIKNYIVLNNRTGKYTRLIQQMESNNFNKVDLINYIEKNNFNGEFDELNGIINGSNKLDDVMTFMRTSKKSIYKEPLQYLNNLSNPKLEDLTSYIKQNNKSGKYAELIEMIEAPSSKRKIQDLENYMRANNADGRYDKIIGLIRKNANLTDVYTYLTNDRDNAVYQELLSRLDQSQPKRELIEKLRLINQNGKYDELVAFASDPKTKVTDILTFINRNNIDNKYKDVLSIVDNPHSIAHYITYMKENNQDGKYDAVLLEISRTDDPKLDVVLSIVHRHNKENKLDDIVSLINQKENPAELIDFIQRRNTGGKYNALLTHLKNNPGNVISNVAAYIRSNNHNGVYADIVNKLNRHDGKNRVSQVLQFIKQSNTGGKYDSVIFELSSYKDPKMTDLIGVVEVHNKNGIFTHLFDIIDQQPNDLQITDLLQYINNNNRKGEYNELLGYLHTINDPKVSDAVSYINKHNKDGKYKNLLQIINQEHIDDPINNTLKYLRANNHDGRYDPLLRELEQQKDLRLIDVLDILKKHNKNGELNVLVKKLNDEKPKPTDDVLAFVNGKNVGGKFNGLIEYLKRKPNAKLNEILNYIHNNNHDGRYNELLDVINGEILKPSKLLEHLRAKNKDGIYDNLIAFIEANPECKMTDIMDFIRSHNGDGRYNPILNYINNNGVEEYADEADVYFKFLSSARRRGEFPELFKYLEQNTLQDPEEILKYMKLNNKDGKYDDLINRTQDYLKLFNKSSKPVSRGRFDLVSALKAKQRACISYLREHCKEQRWLLQHHTGLRRKLINAISNTRSVRLSNAFEKLVNNKKMAISHEIKVKDAQSKLTGRLVRAQADKVLSSLIRLKLNNDNISKEFQKKHGATQIFVNKLRTGLNAKTVEGLKKLNINNVEARKKCRMIALYLLANFANKKKSALHKLISNSLIMKQERDKSKALLYNILSRAIQNKTKCLNRLIQHNRDIKSAEARRVNTLVPMFNKMISATNVKARSVVDALNFNSEDSKRYDEMVEQKLKVAFSKYKTTNTLALATSIKKLRNNAAEAKHREHIQRRTIARLGYAKWKKTREVYSALKDYNIEAKNYYATNKQKLIGAISRLRNNKKELLSKTLELLRAHRLEMVNNDRQRAVKAKNALLSIRTTQTKKLGTAFSELKELARQHNARNAAYERLFASLTNANNGKLSKVIAELLYNKNVSRARREIQRQKISGLFNKMDIASQRKVKVGFSIIKSNNDSINKERQRRIRIAGTIVKRLLDPYAKAQLAALNALRFYNADFNAKYEKRRIVLKNLKVITNSYKNFAVKRYLDLLRDHAAESKNSYEYRRQVLMNLKNINLKYKNNIAVKALNGLRDHNNEQKQRANEFLRAGSILRPIKRRFKDQVQAKYLRVLVDNVKEMKKWNDEFVRNNKLMLYRILNSNELKKKNTLRALVSNMRKLKLDEQKQRQAIKNLIVKAAANIQGLKGQAVLSLRQNKDNALNQQRLTRLIQYNIFNRYDKATKEAKHAVLYTLKTNRDQVNKLNGARYEVIRRLYTNNLLSKTRYALKKLRDYNHEIKHKLGNILNKLPAKQLVKVNSSLALLEANAVHKKYVDEERRNKMSSIVKRYKDNQRSRMSEILRRLANYNELVKGKARYLIMNFNEQQKSLKTQALQYLRDFAQRTKVNDEYKENARRQFLLKLEFNQQIKARSSIVDLKIFSAVSYARKQMNDDKLRSILLKLGKSKLQLCLNRLVVNNKEEIIKENKLRNLITKTVLNCKGLKKTIVNSLKEHNDSVNNQKQLQALASRQLVQNINRRTLSGAFSELKSNKEERNYRLHQALQALKVKTQKNLSEHLNKLRLHRNLLKRNELNSYLTSMALCIRKNHRANLRMVMQHWSNKKLKDITKRMKDVLERLISVRNGQTYQKLKNYYYMKKFNKQIKGLMNLMKWVDEKEDQRVALSYKHMVQLFIDKNPWFAKVIKILAVKSKPNFQVSFWRLKHAKNIYNEHLSASDAIKLKKLTFLMNREIGKNISFGFMRIQNYTDKFVKRVPYLGSSLIPSYK